ncbi:sigma-54 dependent transcriptional regulator [Ignavibacterium sp.]|uniref:sigma-54-dependent transcriptional regulator n=1 Tax=Ignavibacterium sp. TaxID=2651167 RepID=UPI00307DCE29
MKNTILIVDDEVSYLELLKSILIQEGYENVIAESNPLNVENILETRDVDLILLDIYMPEMSGLELLEKIYPKYPNIPVIIVTAVDDKNLAMKAVEFGAYEFIVKPPETDRLFLTIKRALNYKLLEKERDVLRDNLIEVKTEPKQRYEEIIAGSELMTKVFNLVEIFAPTDEIILITGETGTGKDLIAKKIHQLSYRRDKPFVAVNMASISGTLFESELFGHLKGSFTGAISDKQGYFEAANGGTIFLDEIGELPKELQGKLLRVIQYSEIYRIGSSQPIKLDIRIIAATNKDLLEEVQKGNFRADLYYRLNRGYIYLPPLRKRGEDIILLANHFIKIANQKYDKNIIGLSRKAINQLRHYTFPGNVRELENIIFNSVMKSEDNQKLESIDLPKDFLAKKADESITNLISLEEMEKNHILYVMAQVDNNVTRAANILGMSERSLQRKLKKIKEQL